MLKPRRRRERGGSGVRRVGEGGRNERKGKEKETQMRGYEGNVGKKKEKEAKVKINGKEGKETRKRKWRKEGSVSPG